MLLNACKKVDESLGSIHWLAKMSSDEVLDIGKIIEEKIEASLESFKNKLLDQVSDTVSQTYKRSLDSVNDKPKK